MTELTTFIPRSGVLASVIPGSAYSEDLVRRRQVLVVRPGTPLDEVAEDCREWTVFPEVRVRFGRQELCFVPLVDAVPEDGRWLHAGAYLVSNAVLRAETHRITGTSTRHHPLHDHLRTAADARPVPMI